MWCFREHPAYYSWKRELGPQRHDFATWLICGIGWEGAGMTILLILGLLTADEDGGLLRWQWPWKPSIFRRPAIAQVLGAIFDRPFCLVCLRPKKRVMLIASTSLDDEDLKPFDLCWNTRCAEGPRIIRSLGV